MIYKFHARIYVHNICARIITPCLSFQSDTKMDEKLTKLGNLMTASHSSCRDLYDCSCPELEELVRIRMMLLSPCTLQSSGVGLVDTIIDLLVYMWLPT